MAQRRHLHTHQSASSSSRGISNDGAQTGVGAAISPSERTPLIREEGVASQPRSGKAKQVDREQAWTSSPSSSPPPPTPQSSLSHATSEEDVEEDSVLPAFLSSTKQPYSARVALSLQNTGNVARDHLASERTFFAYVRTSLMIATAGVALAQILSFTEFYTKDHTRRFRHVEVCARPLGAAAVVLALIILTIGVARYFTIQHALVQGRFPVARVAATLTAGLVCALIVAAFGVMMDGLMDGLLSRGS